MDIQILINSMNNEEINAKAFANQNNQPNNTEFNINKNNNREFGLIVIVGNLSYLESNFEADQTERVEKIIFEKLSKLYAIDVSSFKKLIKEFQSFIARVNHPSKNWVYGQDKYKHVKIYHPLENVVNDSIKGLVELKTYPRGGDGFTPGSTSSNLNQRSGGSFRVVINTKDWDKSFATNSPGQSGDPNSKFYKNLYEDWTNDKFFPLLFSKSKVLMNLSSRKVYRPIN